ncbi:hypothetical protein MXAN_1886 [Myxococcus xanthus DK 1622]|uniref:Uncharacterized protein n=1 Tax=Myxococcus xanthus (strain DK1622) TaxID=246197 RepID=Q1DB41_MYXXD|nr:MULTISPECIES: hypothetical protein [Myxococcus]ABF89282.1 hypothetical protein MXAN_1886 [Myxococcus xanthus DK 1622]NOJ57784.1 hypothetical protein [Myxococcus xanthus]QPM81474.1 hypothetical protein I5Q59_09380 [Myxococcus xanthus]QVW70724.1 hypothetical protein JTM82_14740 [Myxococcus xanthus DZ2]QZZ49633.1 hypothetical protein MyxoNM_10490 [Myxococcus xanthus]
MSGPAFFQTYMGQRFYETTMPQLVRQLGRLNDNVERLVAVAEQLAGQKEASSAEPARPTTTAGTEEP